MRRPTGRPTKLTAEVQAKIVEAIKAGNYAEVAARHAGIAGSTFFLWKQKGQAGHRVYVEFSEAIANAEAFAEARATAVLSQAMLTDWKAAAWYLERKFQTRWGKRDVQTLTSDPVHPLKVILELHPSHS